MGIGVETRKLRKQVSYSDNSQVKSEAVTRVSVLIRWFSRGALAVLLCAMIALIAGYAVFRQEVGRLELNSPDTGALASISKKLSEPSTGIVVLTGDVARISTGLTLLQKGFGDRLMISGVFERTSRAALLRAANHKPSTIPCCIDIGHAARDTRGNAVEAAHWARQHRFDEVIVVTSNYHMPRSLLEFGYAMPGTRLMPVVAQENNSKGKAGEKLPEKGSSTTAHTQVGFLRHTLKEYGKFMVAVTRIWLEGGFQADASLKPKPSVAGSF